MIHIHILIFRQLADVYVAKHAVSKRDVALATGKAKNLKTGVTGKGQYRTWTPEMMLKVSLLN